MRQSKRLDEADRIEDEATLIRGLVDVLLSTNRASPSTADKKHGLIQEVTSVRSSRQELDACMHMPLRWKIESENEQTPAFPTVKSLTDDAVEERITSVPCSSERQPSRDYWFEIVGARNKALNSDELLEQFVEDLVEKTTTEEARTQTLHRRPCIVQTLSAPIETAPLSENRQSVDKTPPISKIAKQETNRSSKARPTLSEKSKDVETDSKNRCRVSSMQTVVTSPKMNAGKALEASPVETCPVDNTAVRHATTVSRARASIAPALPVQRLWRPTPAFYAACVSTDSETGSSVSDKSRWTASQDMNTTTDSHTESESKMPRPGNKIPVKETSKWKHFRAQHYKAQRQRCVQSHGIYDPLLFTSSTGSKTTSSESEFSICFSTRDLEETKALALPSCQGEC